MVRIVAKETGENLMQCMLEQGAFVDNPCAGKGICGKCKVRVCKGNISDMTAEERNWLNEKEIAQNVRLACMTEAYGEILIEGMRGEREYQGMTFGVTPAFEQEYKECLGLAVDIGTTTVALSLVDRRNGEVLASTTAINAQKKFGLDVLTRISHEYEKPDTGIKDLQEAIVGVLNDCILEVTKAANVNQQDICDICIAANCTMTHMFLGVDARGIGRAPYKPQFLSAQALLAKDVGLNCNAHAKVYCLPHVSAYIGSDIVAGAYVCEMQKKAGNVLFIDIGTNGELVLASKGRLYCCSCAAGPALEGMNITAGMRATVGAIEDIRIQEGRTVLSVIGNVQAEGICGSGILAAVKELLRAGIIKKSGAFEKAYGKAFILQEEPEILVTQGDVRQVQLAKGAILSGILTLLKTADLTAEELGTVIIAGQFGAHLPEDSLIGIGLLPLCVRERLQYVGNSAHTGAYMTLMSERVKKEMEALAKEMEYIELSGTEDYEKLFIKCMKLGEV